MVKHIVCFKLKAPTPELVEKTCEILRSMDGNVPLLRGIFVGADFLHAARSYDILLEVELDNRAALDAYQQDPYHVGVVKKHMHAVAESSVSMDCEY